MKYEDRVPKYYDNISYETVEFAGFTMRSRMDKAVHTLEGLIKGIAIDGVINEKEKKAVKDWVMENPHVRKRPPFTEIIPMIEVAITQEEKEDLLWVCQNFQTDSLYFNAITSDIQRLQGIMAGIAADGIIEKEELESLEVWLEAHEDLQSTWPYDEIASLITVILADGVIDEAEHELLLAYFRDFIDAQNSPILKPEVEIKNMTLGGVCAVCPDIQFNNRKFCFTGKSSRATRKAIQETIEANGAKFQPKEVYGNTNYLVIGAGGSPVWTFSCYGRKIEKAMQLRKEGHPVVLVHENDFWDAVEDQ